MTDPPVQIVFETALEVMLMLTSIKELIVAVTAVLVADTQPVVVFLDCA